MAIPRDTGISSITNEGPTTHAPDSALKSSRHECYQTSDIDQIRIQYQSDTETIKEEKIFTGALLPRDMTVKLVRAESANWETFLQVLYSLTLTLFGIFLGSWISASSAHISFTSLEAVATISFGAISMGLIIAWAILKYRQATQSVVIPYELLNRYGKHVDEQ